MRFMLLLKGDPPAGATPDEKLIEAMVKFNEDMVNAGVLLAAEGLHSSERGARVSYADGERRVIDGPFTESKELIAGFYLIEVKSREEAIEWAKRCPVEFAPIPAGEEAVVEVRQVAETTELPEMTEELRERDDRIRDTFTGG
jgi:hypothetical protein